MKFKIAVVQFKIKEFLPEKNLKKAEKFIKQASKKAEIIVFPEYFLTGSIPGKKEFNDKEKKYLKIFQTLAKKYEIDIVTGSIIEEEKAKIYNTTYYIEANGKIRGKYKKINLWHTEKKHYQAGKEVSVFKTKFGKIGLINCWDLIFPEVFRAMLKKGVEIVICPSYWCYGDGGNGIKYDKNAEIKLVDSLCIARAFENEIVVVYCNTARELRSNKPADEAIGHSQITVPFKGVIKKLSHNKEAMFIQEIDTSILKDAEKAYKIRADLKKTK